MFLISFYDNDKLMREVQLETERIDEAIKIATETVKGYIYWDKIKAKKL